MCDGVWLVFVFCIFVCVLASVLQKRLRVCVCDLLCDSVRLGVVASFVYVCGVVV